MGSFEDRLIDAGTTSRDEFDAVWEELRADIAEAIEFAEDSPMHDPDQILVDVYTDTPVSDDNREQMTGAAS